MTNKPRRIVRNDEQLIMWLRLKCSNILPKRERIFGRQHDFRFYHNPFLVSDGDNKCHSSAKLIDKNCDVVATDRMIIQFGREKKAEQKAEASKSSQM